MSEQKLPTFGLQVISVNGVFYDDRAQEIILPCEDGELAILAGHEEMILAISDGVIKIKTLSGDWIYGVVSLGSVQVAHNRCIVIVNTVEIPEEIDKIRAQEAYDFAMEHLLQKQSIKEFKKSQAGLARAMTRLKASSKYSGLK